MGLARLYFLSSLPYPTLPAVSAEIGEAIASIPGTLPKEQHGTAVSQAADHRGLGHDVRGSCSI